MTSTASYMDTLVHWWLLNRRSTGWWCWRFDFLAKRSDIGSSFIYSKIGHKKRCRSDRPKRQMYIFFTDFRPVLDSLAGHGEYNLRRKLYSILENRQVVLQWFLTYCGIKGNEHADRLAKQRASTEQDELPITFKQRKNNNEKQVQRKKDTIWLPHTG